MNTGIFNIYFIWTVYGNLIYQISKSELDTMFQSILKIASFWNVMNLSIKDILMHFWSDLKNIGDFVLIKWAPPTLEIEQNHKNCKGVQSSGTMHQHLNWYAQNASHGYPEWFKYQKLIKHFHVFLNILSNG